MRTSASSAMSRHPALRWAAPAAALLVVGGVAVAVNSPASADSGLPPRTAQQLLVDLQTAKVDGLSGTVRLSADLGLPALPSTNAATPGSMAGSVGSLGGALGLLSGTHTFRVWAAGPDKARVALLDGTNETDWVTNGTDAWTWSSADKSVVHATVPAAGTMPGAPTATGTAGSAHPKQPTAPLGTSAPKTPDEAAAQVLSALDPTTTVTTAGAGTVAGRPAYDLVLAPKDSASLVQSVRISLDSATKTPVAVAVFAKAQTAPALEVAFTSVDYTVPPASRFAFTPPAGSTVTQADAAKPANAPAAQGKTAGKPTVVGQGWTSVAVVNGMPAASAAGPTASSTADPASDPTATSGATGSASAAKQGANQAQAYLQSLPKVSGSWGTGHLLSTSLLTLVVTDDGRVAAGAVSPDAVYAALAKA